MDFTLQEGRASDRHAAAAVEGKACIDCHIGIAHRLPADAFQAYETVVEGLGN